MAIGSTATLCNSPAAFHQGARHQSTKLQLGRLVVTSSSFPNDGPRRCSSLRLEGAVFVKAPANFGSAGEKKQVCRAHAQEGTVPSGPSRKCDKCGSPLPTFGYPGTKPRFCKVHSEAGMVSIQSPARASEGRTMSAGPSSPGQEATRPRKARAQGGERTCAHADESVGDSSRTEFKRCTHPASFNFPGENASHYCTAHAMPGMMKFVDN